MIQKLEAPKCGRPPIHPWGKWTNGKTHSQQPDNPQNFIRILRAYAKRHSFELVAVRSGKSVRFQFTKVTK